MALRLVGKSAPFGTAVLAAEDEETRVDRAREKAVGSWRTSSPTDAHYEER